MKGKPTRRRRLQMLHDPTKDGGYAILKRAAEERQGWRYSGITGMMSESSVQ